MSVPEAQRQPLLQQEPSYEDLAVRGARVSATGAAAGDPQPLPGVSKQGGEDRSLDGPPSRRVSFSGARGSAIDWAAGAAEPPRAAGSSGGGLTDKDAAPAADNAAAATTMGALAGSTVPVPGVGMGPSHRREASFLEWRGSSAEPAPERRPAPGPESLVFSPSHSFFEDALSPSGSVTSESSDTELGGLDHAAPNGGGSTPGGGGSTRAPDDGGSLDRVFSGRMQHASTGVAVSGHVLSVSQERLLGHEAPVTCCSFSPSGRNVASASTDGTVRIWAPRGANGDDSRKAVLLCGARVTAMSWDCRADKV